VEEEKAEAWCSSRDAQQEVFKRDMTTQPVTMSMKTEKYRPLIDAAVALVGLPPWSRTGRIFLPGEWFEGIILHESSGDPRAIHHDGAPDDIDTTSYGLMQIEGRTAKGLGWDGKSIEALFLPIQNIAYGLRVIAANLGGTGQVVESAIARYNGGGFGNPIWGPLRNQPYVDAVADQSWIAHLDRARKLRG
jgi:soluble lytic murein transglycosylase-like protein